MKKVKKVLAIVLTVVLMAGLFAGCGSSQEDTNAAEVKDTANNAEDSKSAGAENKSTAVKKDMKDITIGLSMKTLSAPYFAAQMNAAKKKCEELGVKFIGLDAQGQMSKQIADVEDLIARQVDIILLNPTDPKGMVPATKAAKKAGVPVIIIDSSIDPSADFITTVQSNNLENGKLVGDWLGSQMKGKAIKMAVLSGEQGNPAGENRRNGVFWGLTEYQLREEGKAGFEIVAQGWGNWANEGGLKAMEDILVAHPDINVLVTENDSMALGAIKAIEAAGKKNDILIAAAADGQKEAYALIKEGEYGATGMNDPALVATTGVETAIKVLNGETDFPKVYYTQPMCITKENVDKYYRADADF
ncbi:substrate-binding domain-containing protein [Petroclostridium sp. X23]|uniref:substrate-binding domain-containing protein n=1 Tax=Petroclostridium sp. X23 TaxID=3045146 RepID=UPI0024AD2434|nr:substrate-binding domain-containing protein [Petroclostridium sp. X23]WHH58507.1 substrate-binding domain-containing protein [Petroclostridium sp. X23]